MNLKTAALTAAVLTLVVAPFVLFRGSRPHSDGRTLPGASGAASPARATGDGARHPSPQTFPDLENPASSLDALVRQALETPWPELGIFSQQFRPLFEEDPEAALALLEKLCFEIASHNPAHALDLAENLIDLDGVTSIERRILHSWVTGEAGAIQEHFTSRGDSASDHRISLLASLVQNELAGSLDQWIDWIGKLAPAPGDPAETPSSSAYLQGVFAEKLVTHATPRTLDTVAGLLQDNAHNRAVAAQATLLAPKIAESDPKAGLEWITGIELDHDIREGAIDNIFYHLGTVSPDVAAGILSSPNIASQLYRPRSPGESAAERLKNEEAFFDMLLASYLEASLGAAPAEGHINSELFNDPKLREEYQSRAEELAFYYATNPEARNGGEQVPAGTPQE